jgi:hypothetical protein
MQKIEIAFARALPAESNCGSNDNNNSSPTHMAVCYMKVLSKAATFSYLLLEATTIFFVCIYIHMCRQQLLSRFSSRCLQQQQQQQQQQSLLL